MKIVITGSLGNISQPLTKALVQKGHSITVISSKPDRARDIEALSATAAIGSIEDVKFLAATFTGADAVYTMVPPNYHFDSNLDLLAYYPRIAGHYARAIQQSGVTQVVHLSSIGAHLAKGTGLIVSHHDAEVTLNHLSHVGITFMRPTSFYYNLYSFLPVIKSTGQISSNYGEDDRIVWVAPIDIATAIADEIVTPLAGRKVRYVASEELTCNAVAGILGTAIGKPEMKWTVIPDEEMQSRLTAFGLPPIVAAGLVEMNASQHTGLLFEDYYRHRPALGKTKMTEFAKEFAAAFAKND